MNNRSATADMTVKVENETPEHATPEMANLILRMANLMQRAQAGGTKAERDLLVFRRQIRNRLFRIRDAMMRGETPSPQHDSGLKKWIELQFRDGMTWYKMMTDEKNKKFNGGGFTFEWDVSAQEPLKVIDVFEWDGDIDQEMFIKTGKKICIPPAFTKQK